MHLAVVAVYDVQTVSKLDLKLEQINKKLLRVILPFSFLFLQFLLQKNVKDGGIRHQSSKQEEYASCNSIIVTTFKTLALSPSPNIQDDMAVIPSVLGDTLVTLLKMLMSTRKRVTSRAIRPGTTSGGMRKLTQEVITNREEGR